MGIGRKVNVWTIVFGRVLAVDFLVKHQPRQNYINTAPTVGQRWTARKNELVGIENSNKLPIRGDLMISLNFSIDINPQVFYILVGLYVVYKIIKLVWLLDVKNRIKW